MRSKLLISVAAVMALAVVAPAARAETTCSFGGPSPGFRVVQLDLPNGSDYATIHLSWSRPSMPAGDRSSWHLAMGFAIVNAITHELVTTRVYNAGSSTRRAAVVASGMQVARQDITGPDVTFVHTAWAPVDRLAPGSYYLIGFGSDGDDRLPNPWWGADFHLSASVACTSIGQGDIFDIDHSDFGAGTQATASAAGVAMNAQGGYHTARSMVFGLMDVAQQGAGSATLDYAMPDGAFGTISNEIVPFFSGPGDYTFTTNFAGVAPIAEIAGVAFDV